MAAAAVARKTPKPTPDNAMLYVLGGIIVLSLVKGAALKVFEPVARIAKQAVEVGDELTGGLQGDPGTVTYWSEFDVPFSDVQIPLVNVKEPDQNWMDYATTFDLPGVPEYNVRELPGDIKRFFGRIF